MNIRQFLQNKCSSIEITRKITGATVKFGDLNWRESDSEVSCSVHCEVRDGFLVKLAIVAKLGLWEHDFRSSQKLDAKDFSSCTQTVYISKTDLDKILTQKPDRDYLQLKEAAEKTKKEEEWKKSALGRLTSFVQSTVQITSDKDEKKSDLKCRPS